MSPQDPQPQSSPQPISRQRLTVVGFAGMGLLLLFTVLAVAAGRLLLGGGQVVVVEVRDGVFRPAVVEARAGEPLRLRIVVRDRAACPAQVAVPGLQASLPLPASGAGELSLPAARAGSYAIDCGEGLAKGTLKLR